MARIGGSSTKYQEYVAPDNRPPLSQFDDIWPGAYTLARRYVAHKGNPKMQDVLMSKLRLCLIQAPRPENMQIEPGYFIGIAVELIALASVDGVELP